MNVWQEGWKITVIINDIYCWMIIFCLNHALMPRSHSAILKAIQTLTPSLLLMKILCWKNRNFSSDSWWPHNNFTFWLIAYWKWRYGIKGTWAERGWESSRDGNAHSYLSQESEFNATKFTEGSSFHEYLGEVLFKDFFFMWIFCEICKKLS